MKKWMKFTVLALVSLFVLSCSNTLMGDGGLSGDSTTPPTDGKTARVIIQLPGSSGRAVGVGNAKTIANYYAVHYKKQGETTYSWTAAVPGREIVEIQITAGTYDFLVFAGYSGSNKNGTGSSFLGSPLLLGSGYLENKQINPGENVFSIGINTVDIDIFCYTGDDKNDHVNTIPVSAPFYALVTINTKNPLFKPPADLNMYYKLQGSEASTFTPGGDPADGTQKDYIWCLMAPGSVGGGEIGIETTSVSPFPEAVGNGLNWCLVNDDFSIESDPPGTTLTDVVFKKNDIGFSVFNGDVTLSLGWVEDQ
jgi:hypothetical protein